MPIKIVKEYVDPVARYFGTAKEETPAKKVPPNDKPPKRKVVHRKLADFPQYAAEFNVDRNRISPDQVAAMSHTKYWWQCPKCGHEWQTSCNNRVFGSTRCPECVKARRRNQYR